MDLALDDQRIDDAAEIVGAGEVDKLDRARLAINFDLGKTKGSLYCWAIAAHPESLGVQFDMPVAAGRCGGGDARASSPAIKNSTPGARQSPTFRPDHRSPRAPGRVVTFLIPGTPLRGG
jgi:hypothetical protein